MITYNEPIRTIKLDTPNTSYVLGIRDGGFLLNLYYGRLAAVSGIHAAFYGKSISFCALKVNRTQRGADPVSKPEKSVRIPGEKPGIFL